MAKILPCGSPVRPSPWVMRWRHLIDPSGEVLDLACGEGRHTAMLLLEGRRVLACDINLSGMTALKDHPLLTLEARDLEGDPWPWGSERFVISVAVAGISVNLMLMAFNLIPIPPLDGGRILRGLLPWRAALMLDRVEPYGMVILLVLMAAGVLWYFAKPFLMVGEWLVGLLL